MSKIIEGDLTFCFPDDWQVTKFDGWSFYRNQFQQVCGGAKAIDILALAPDYCLWLIEVKDYRQQRRAKTIELTDEIAYKVRDSLAALVAARVVPVHTPCITGVGREAKGRPARRSAMASRR